MDFSVNLKQIQICQWDIFFSPAFGGTKSRRNSREIIAQYHSVRQVNSGNYGNTDLHFTPLKKGKKTARFSRKSSISPYVTEKIIMECKLCGKSFTTRNGLKDHMAKHAGTERYRCMICQKSFIHRHHYEGHMAGHDPSRMVHCQHCQKAFVYKTSCDKHEKSCVYKTQI